MKQPWHIDQPNLLEQFKRDLAKTYPDLCVIESCGVVIAQGGFPILQDASELDRFQIRMVVPATFPKKIPIVFELGGRVPLNNPDWHTYDGGSLCLIVPEEWLINPQHESLMAFLNGPVRNYFIAHALSEEGIGRPMGERPHFGDGLWEAYGEMVASKDRALTQRFLECLADDKIRGHVKCPCGSDKKMRHCHMAHLLELKKKIKSAIAESALKRLKLRD